MHSVLIVIHLFVAIGLVSVILLQRSEGGALGMGGGPGGLMSGRAAGNVLTRTTTWLALVFFATSISLTLFTTAQADRGSIVDRVNPDEVAAPLRAPAAESPADLLGAPADEAAPTGEEPAPTPEQPTPEGP